MTERKKDEPSAEAARPRRSKRRDAAKAEPVKREKAPQARLTPDWSLTLGLCAAALLIGAAGGWFGRGRRGADATVVPDSAAPAGSAVAPSGPCSEWSKELCLRLGEESDACERSKSASELLPISACVAARADIGATVAKIEASRATCNRLADKLCNDLGKDTKTCKLVRDKTQSFPPARCEQMMSQYDNVLAELRQMEKAEAPISQDLATRQSAGDTPGFGAAGAKVTVVEYSDFECPFCARAAEVVKKLKEKYGDKIRFVFRQFPLSMHPNASLAAEAALAAHAQGKFWPFHDLLFENQRELDRKSLEGYAAKAGLDVAKFKKALDDHTYAAAVQSDMKLGEEGGVSGTPSMFIGTERVENPTDFDSLAAELDGKLGK